MNVNDLLIELDKRDTLLANDAAAKIRELIKANDVVNSKVDAYRNASTAYDKALLIAFPQGAAGLVAEHWNDARKAVFRVENSRVFVGTTGHVKGAAHE